jgi:transmembrane sensor
MKIPETRPDLHEQAAAWFLKTRAGPLPDREALRLDLWLTADPTHQAVFDEVARTWEIADSLAASDPIQEMRSAALAARADRRSPWHSPVWGAMAAMVLLTVLAAGAFGAWRLFLPPAPEVQVYRTGVGERATVTLADGSQATLNTATVLAVDYRRERRGVRLMAGEAWFDVAKNPNRPFVVSAADHQVVAIGTSFNVRLDPGRLRVAVSEGRVRLSDASDAPLAAISAGQSADLKASGLILGPGGPTTGDWREGRLHFNAAPLAEAVIEMNRYRKTPIVLADSGVERLRISGVFDTGEASSFLEALPLSQPVRVVRLEDEVRIETERPRK